MSDHLLLQLAIILIAAKLGGEICVRWLKQPAVLGEIVGGVLVGVSGLKWIPGDSSILGSIAEIGAVLLLFEVGLESDIEELFKVGAAALWVAVTGVIFAFALGYAVAAGFHQPPLSAVFIGAAVTATSVGITARVFKDIHALHTREARIVLGAAVADDVIGLIVVAAVTGLAITKVISVASIAKLTMFAVVFLVGSVVIGQKATPWLLRVARKMQTRAAMPAVAIIFCLLLASLAEVAQLAPIVGAFAAGLVLAKTDHKIHFEEKIKSVADIFVPVFFVMIGARMNLASISLATSTGRAALFMGILLLIAVAVGKVAAGLTVPAKNTKRWTVGIGMIPRGEVTLISATIGLQAHVISDSIYAAIVFVVLCTTLVTPPLLKAVVIRGGPKGGNAKEPGATPSVLGLQET